MRGATSRPFPITTIARYTIKSYIKERVLLVVLIFAFTLILASHVLAPLAVGAREKIIVDIGLAAISMFGIVLVVLLGASSYSKEREIGILPNILVKPIHRVDFILGKFLGTIATVALVMLSMAVVYTVLIVLSQATFRPIILMAIYLSVVEIVLITGVMTFFSSFTSPLLASLFTICTVIIGRLSNDLLDFAGHFGGKVLNVVSVIIYYTVPNLSLFNIRPETVHNLPLPEGLLYAVTIYGLFYTLLVLLLSSLIFRGKDIA